MSHSKRIPRTVMPTGLIKRFQGPRGQGNPGAHERDMQFRLLSENTRDLVYRYRLRPQPGFDYISPSANVLTGYTPEEFYADPARWLNVLHPGDRYVFERALESGTLYTAPLVLRWVGKDGTVCWMKHLSRA